MRITAHAFHGQSDDAVARYEEWEQIRGQLAMNSIFLDHIAHTSGARILLSRGNYREASDRYRAALEAALTFGSASLAYGARGGLAATLAMSRALDDALDTLRVETTKLVGAQREAERSARLLGLAAVNHMLGQSERARDLLAATLGANPFVPFVGTVSIRNVLADAVGAGVAPPPGFDRQAMIDAELVALTALAHSPPVASPVSR